MRRGWRLPALLTLRGSLSKSWQRGRSGIRGRGHTWLRRRAADPASARTCGTWEPKRQHDIIVTKAADWPPTSSDGRCRRTRTCAPRRSSRCSTKNADRSHSRICRCVALVVPASTVIMNEKIAAGCEKPHDPAEWVPPTVHEVTAHRRFCTPCAPQSRYCSRFRLPYSP